MCGRTWGAPLLSPRLKDLHAHGALVSLHLCLVEGVLPQLSQRLGIQTARAPHLRYVMPPVRNYRDVPRGAAQLPHELLQRHEK